jgi:thiamine-monophosphate kinase
LTPTARIAAGQKLVRLVPQPAAIDISDGLWQDLGHILKRSGLGAEVAAESIPLSNAYRAVAGNDVRHACTGGDDYELLFCMPRASETQLRRKLGVQVTRIGTIVKGRRATLVAGGRRVTTGLAGWNQLRDG